MVSERTECVNLIQEANQAGARLHLTCEEAGITLRTYRRWYRDGQITADKRPDAIRPQPSNKLTEAEQAKIVEVCNWPKFASLPPSQIVPTLLDEDEYYIADLLGMKVLLEDGSEFGTLKNVMETGANDVYIVDSVEHGEVLLPAIKECILDVDIETNTMTVHLMKGLL